MMGFLSAEIPTNAIDVKETSAISSMSVSYVDSNHVENQPAIEIKSANVN